MTTGPSFDRNDLDPVTFRSYRTRQAFPIHPHLKPGARLDVQFPFNVAKEGSYTFEIEAQTLSQALEKFSRTAERGLTAMLKISRRSGVSAPRH